MDEHVNFQLYKNDRFEEATVYAIRNSWQNFGELWQCEKDDDSLFFSEIKDETLMLLNNWSACWVNTSKEDAWRYANNIDEDVPVESFSNENPNWQKEIIQIDTTETHLVFEIEYWYTQYLILSPEDVHMRDKKVID